MKFSCNDLESLTQAGIITPEQKVEIAAFFNNRRSLRPHFDLAHLLWYAGSLIIMGAMTLFATLAFAQMGGKALTVTALFYALFFTVSGNYFWNSQNLKIPGGLLITCAIAMAPMAVFGIQDQFDWWTHGDPGNYNDFYIWIRGSWLPMELVTIAVTLIAFYFYPFPFMMFVLSFTLWNLSMDLTEVVYGRSFSWEMRRWIAEIFGLVILAIAWLVDLKPWKSGDFAFWFHLFGLLIFWGAVSSQNSNSEVAKALYCGMNIVLILISVFLIRRAYAVFGGLGVFFYLSHLSYKVFKDSLVFPFALSLAGLVIILIGIIYFKKKDRITDWMNRTLPEKIKRLRPAHTFQQ